MSPYQIHRILQAIAFLVLFPIGGLVAIFRSYIGPKWLPVHIAMQLTATLTVFTAVIIVVVANRKYAKEHGDSETVTPPLNKIHKLNGRVVASLLLIQILWAFLGRKLVPWTVWYYIHVALASLIILLGFTNLYLGYRITHST